MVKLPRRTALQWMGMLASALWLLSGCSGGKHGWGDADDGSPENLPKEGALAGLKVNETLVTGLNQFGWDLLRALPEGNQLISPASLGLCLAMLERGAEGATRAQIRKLLHLPEKPDLADPGWKTLSQFLKVEKANRQVWLANGLFLQSGSPIGADFRKELNAWFQVKLREVDFKSDTVQAARSINDWAHKRSENGSEEILGANALSSETDLVLVNLIQFEGRWDKGFHRDYTHPRDFEWAPGQKKSVPFMHRPPEECETRQTQLARSIELPCKGYDRSVHIILPKKRHGLAELFDGKTDPQWRQLIFEPGHFGDIEVSLPKLTLELTLELKNPLSQLGMTNAFDADVADFSRMTGGLEPIQVQQVLHNTRFALDEDGARAMATTVGEVTKSAPEPINRPFIANQPFLVVITDKTTQSILFLGRVNDPI